MGKNKNSIWAQEVQYEEINLKIDNAIHPENLITGAYEAVNRFCQKEHRRSKHSKRRKDCWQ